MARTQDERKAETRARLLHAAADLFAAHGIDAVSVDAVADAAGRTSGAVYAHFGSKQGMVLALLDEWRHSLVAGLLAAFERTAELDDRLRAVAEDLIVSPTAATQRLVLLEEELRLRAMRDPDVAGIVRARAAETRRFLARGFASWVAQGLLDTTTPPDVLATSFLATVTGLQALHRIDPDAVTTDVAVAAMAAAIGAVLPAAAPA